MVRLNDAILFKREQVLSITGDRSLDIAIRLDLTFLDVINVWCG